MCRAMEGDGLERLVRLAMPVCQQAERRCPRQGPGRKPIIPEWVMLVLIMVATAKRRKSKSAQYRFLSAARNRLLGWMQIDCFPSRSTYFDRFRRAHALLRQVVEGEGRLAIQRGWADARAVAVDKSLIAARGPGWHQRDRRRRHRPSGVDVQASWTYSEYHGWLYGYGYEIVVSAGKRGPVWPLLASVEQAHVRENSTFPEKIARLPRRTRYVLADQGYDSNDHAEAVEQATRGRARRRFVCPLQERHNATGKPSVWRCSHRRRERRLLRDARRQWMSRPFARRLYARRRITVEPFNEWLKTLFDLHEHAWHRGLDNNRTQLLATLFTYQLLLHANRLQKRPNAQVTWLLDTL